MKTRTKNCKNCFAHRMLYSRLSVFFPETKHSYCAFYQKPIDADSVCENWQKEKLTYDLSPERIDEAMRDVKIISDYCKDLE